MSHPQVYVSPLLLEYCNNNNIDNNNIIIIIHPSHPIPPLRLSQSFRSELPLSMTNFHWLSNFTYGKAHVSTLLSQLVPPSPSPHVFPSLFSMSASPLLPCR